MPSVPIDSVLYTTHYGLHYSAYIRYKTEHLSWTQRNRIWIDACDESHLDIYLFNLRGSCRLLWRPKLTRSGKYTKNKPEPIRNGDISSTQIQNAIGNRSYTWDSNTHRHTTHETNSQNPFSSSKLEIMSDLWLVTVLVVIELVVIHTSSTAGDSRRIGRRQRGLP